MILNMLCEKRKYKVNKKKNNIHFKINYKEKQNKSIKINKVYCFSF